MYYKKNTHVINNTLIIILTLFCLCSFIFSASGCSRVKIRGLVPAEGILLYEDLPLAWAIVSFAPENATGNTRLGTAQTNEKGRFVMTTLGDRGILSGNYKISVTKYIPDEGKASVTEWQRKRREAGFAEPRPDENVLKVVLAIPDKFTTTKNSGLTYTIEENGNRNMTIELK
ncbi:MAG: hypothetical protein LBJ67_07490 [Planctomycetaceae bacterium]|jgi:hypothetical protein|nr:hypothetical protein [Planctomycetaceae bacterium]